MMEWIKQALNSGITGNPSSKRLVFLISSAALVAVLLAIGAASAYRVFFWGDLGNGSVAALVTVSGAVATLAGYGYRKPDTGEKP